MQTVSDKAFSVFTICVYFLFVFVVVVRKNVSVGAKSVQRSSLALAQIGEHTD